MKKYSISIFGFLLIMILSLSANASPSILPVYQGFGGNFEMDSTLGHKASLHDFNDKVVLLSFGYTNCPDVCPVTLNFLNNAIKRLKDQQKKVQVLFVSVDPDYDTTDHLKMFLDYFNPDFVGLSGSREEIDHVTALYNIRYSKTSDLQISTEYRKLRIVKKNSSPKKDTSSLYTHSTLFYLIDFQGRIRAIFDTTTPTKKVAYAIKLLLQENKDHK